LSAPPGIRTPTLRNLNPTPLPVGPEGQSGPGYLSFAERLRRGAIVRYEGFEPSREWLTATPPQPTAYRVNHHAVAVAACAVVVAPQKTRPPREHRVVCPSSPGAR